MLISLCLLIGNKALSLFFFIDSLLDICLIFIMYSYIEVILSKRDSFDSLVDDIDTLEGNLINATTLDEQLQIQVGILSLQNQLFNISDEIIGMIFNLLYILTMSSGYFLTNLWWYIYAALKHKYLKYGLFIVFINVLNMGLMIYQYVKINTLYYSYWNQDQTSWSLKTINDLQNETNIRIYTFAGLIWGIQFIRLFNKLHVSEYFGPLIQIFAMMIINLSKLWVISFLLFLWFFWAGRIIFNDETAFQSWFTTLKVLYLATFSNFDFSDFENNITTVNIIGAVFIIVYTLVMSLILINFMIAIVSYTYEAIQNQSKAVYLKSVAKVKYMLTDDKYYSSLIFSYNPMIFMTFPFLIVLVFYKSKKLNNIIMHFLYVPVMLLSSLVYMVCSLVLLPFSYVLLVLKWIKVILQRVREKCWASLLNLILCSIVGIPALLLIVIKDTICFTKNLYQTDLKFKYIPEGDERIFSKFDPYFTNIFIQIMEKMDQENRVRVEATEIIKLIRVKFEVHRKVFDLLFGVGREAQVSFK